MTTDSLVGQKLSHAVELVVHQDSQFQFWAARLLAVQAGLAVALGALLRWDQGPVVALEPWIVVLISLFGTISAVSICSILLRQLAWQGAHVESVKLLEGDNKQLFRDDMVRGGRPLTKTITTVRMLLILAWAAFACGYVIVSANLHLINHLQSLAVETS